MQDLYFVVVGLAYVVMGAYLYRRGYRDGQLDAEVGIDMHNPLGARSVAGEAEGD